MSISTSPTESNPRVSAWLSSGLGTATAIAAAWGMIVLDDRKETLDKLFEQVEYAGPSDYPYALERHIPVFLCRGAKLGTLAQVWPNLKRWR